MGEEEMSREEGDEGRKGKEREEDEDELDEASVDEIFREMEALGARKRSRRREEIEAALKKADTGEGALILLNLDSGECLSFDSYSKALEHMGKQKGRWYLAPKGIDRDAFMTRKSNGV
jgi:hypothetical protein